MFALRATQVGPCNPGTGSLEALAALLFDWPEIRHLIRRRPRDGDRFEAARIVWAVDREARSAHELSCELGHVTFHAGDPPSCTWQAEAPAPH